MSLTNKINTGFKESLKPSPDSLKNKTPQLTDDRKNNVCKEILNMSKLINNKYNIPSQFPLLTGTLSNKKKGGRKKRKTLRKRKCSR